MIQLTVPLIKMVTNKRKKSYNPSEISEVATTEPAFEETYVLDQPDLALRNELRKDPCHIYDVDVLADIAPYDADWTSISQPVARYGCPFRKLNLEERHCTVKGYSKCGDLK